VAYIEELVDLILIHMIEAIVLGELAPNLFNNSRNFK
jgi:hypothetical protein